MARQLKNNQMQRKLRRYALAGKWSAVRALLQERLRQEPKDEEARAELERLDSGQSLHLLETAKQREKRLAQEACDKVRRMMEKYPESTLHSIPTRAIRQLLSELHQLCRQMKRGGMAPVRAVDSFLRKLNNEARHRGVWRLRRALWWAGGAGVAGGMVWLAVSGLSYRAASLNDELAANLQQGHWSGVHSLLRTADTGINRLLCPALKDNISAANQWVTLQKLRYRTVEQQLRSIEEGRRSVASLDLRQRAVLEQELHALPRGYNDLLPRWKRLCEREHTQLELQKKAVLEELAAPLPPLLPLQGSPAQDEHLLKQQLLALEGRCQMAEDACAGYGLDRERIKPLIERRDYLRACLADITHLRFIATMLPYARNYGQYRQWLEQFAPQQYPPAMQMLDIRNHLPSEDSLKELMQDPEKELPPGILDAAREAVMNGGPSFIPTYPANRIQVALMEDPFTSDSLRRPLLELTLSNGSTYYTEEDPEVNYKGVRFRLSSLDPAYVAGENNTLTWTEAHGVWKRTIDTTGLLAAAGIDRASFFRDKNLPLLLTNVLQYRNPHCPALAQASLYDCLVQVMEAHDYPVMLGIRYAPTLRADIRSFKALKAQLKVSLRPGCWIGATPDKRRAEAAFAQWFRQHRKHHYAAEMAANFRDLVQIHPHFCGYIGENLRPVLCTPVKKGTLLWYISDGAVTASPAGAPLEKPAMFSPVFTVERDSDS